MKFDNTLIQVLDEAHNFAKQNNHEYVTPEHVLYVSLFSEDGLDIMENVGADPENLKKALLEFFKDNMEVYETPEPMGSVSLYNAIESSKLHAMSAQNEVIELGNLLVAIHDEPESFASYFMKEEGITRLKLLNYISHGISSIMTEDGEPYYENGEYDDEDFEMSDGANPMDKRDFIKAFTSDITEKANKGEIDPLIGRQDVLDRTIQVLSRRMKNNPVHVGDPGVGKTAITEGLATLIKEGKVPDNLKKSKIFHIDMGTMLAGTKYRGDFEERIKKVLTDLSKLENAIVYIDEIHTVVGAGATSSGSMDASNILKPFLTSGKLKVIGATTHEEYKKFFEKDRALARRFQKIDINEPTVEETYQILVGLKDKYEEFHNVTYTDKALHAAAELSAKFIQDRHLPDKAIDVLDETGALIKIKNISTDRAEVTEKDIELTISKIAKIPEKSVSENEIGRLRSIETDIKSKIFGQDTAIDTVSRAVKRSRAGFNDTQKPVASLLFVGPTGVGKTELARQLAEVLGVPVIRFDMSEYQEKHTVARLIGSPPGYVGYEEGGLLTDAIRKTPHCVLLLDEMEKAHSDIYNVFLQIMDYATLSDNTGKKADFRNVVIIMTSNAGAREVGKKLIGFGELAIEKSVIKKEVDRIFSPEFRNRLDEIVVFNHINVEMALQIAKKAIGQFAEKLTAKNIELLVSDECYKWLSAKGISSVYGAREIYRLIQDKVKPLFVDEVLFGKLSNGGKAELIIENDTIVYRVL